MPAFWVSKSGKVVLSGDAAHAVLLYAGQVKISCFTLLLESSDKGQGGSIPLEDVVTLAECLDRAGTIDDILKVLRAY
jgi:2-polyprenyl-6-methoxyphenol hydroxylase-like FAD-dependent oxidoreductase